MIKLFPNKSYPIQWRRKFNRGDKSRPALSTTAISFKQIRLFFRDARVERLELEPAGEGGADLLAGQFSVLVFE